MSSLRAVKTSSEDEFEFSDFAIERYTLSIKNYERVSTEYLGVTRRTITSIYSAFYILY